MKTAIALLTSITLLMSVSPVHAEQVCYDKLRATAPDSRFEAIGDGTVKDKQTELIWQRCSIGQTLMNGQCTGELKTLTWQQALTQAKSYGEGWRLPNAKELNSILAHSCTSPKINAKFFPIFPDSPYILKYFWTSTPYKYQPEVNESPYIVIVDLSSGEINAATPLATEVESVFGVFGLAVKSAE